MDQNKKQLIENLMIERYYGKYRDDIEGFIFQYNNIRGMPNTSEPTVLEGISASPLTIEGRAKIAD